MKKSITIALVFAIALVTLVMPAQALESSTGSASPAKTRLEELKRIREEKAAALKARIEEKKQTRVENMEQKREDFQARLAKVKDAVKQRVLGALDKAIQNINARWTEHFKNVLEHLTKITDKLKLLAQDQNNSVALKAIEDIYAQISKTEAAVEAQAAKIYEVDLIDETKFKEEAQATREELRTDLEALRTQIKDIREDIRSVFLSLRPATTPKATPSVTITPTITVIPTVTIAPTVTVTPTATIIPTATVTPTP